jgi:hypothetical protein
MEAKAGFAVDHAVQVLFARANAARLMNYLDAARRETWGAKQR